jgi:antitoxin ParD1/3/4
MNLEQEGKIEALRAALISGEQSGPSRPFDFDAFIDRKRRAAKRKS